MFGKAHGLPLTEQLADDGAMVGESIVEVELDAEMSAIPASSGISDLGTHFGVSPCRSIRTSPLFGDVLLGIFSSDWIWVDYVLMCKNFFAELKDAVFFWEVYSLSRCAAVPSLHSAEIPRKHPDKARTCRPCLNCH